MATAGLFSLAFVLYLRQSVTEADYLSIAALQDE